MAYNNNAIEKAPKNIALIQEQAEKISSGLSREMVDSTVKKLVGARHDLSKRRRHLPEEDKDKANEAVQMADDLIKLLTAPPPPPILELALSTPSEQTDSDLIDVLNIKKDTETDITVLEEEFREILSISEKLGFSTREQRIFQLIIEAIAAVSGGRDTEEFARYLQKIEEVLQAEFAPVKQS